MCLSEKYYGQDMAICLHPLSPPNLSPSKSPPPDGKAEAPLVDPIGESVVHISSIIPNSPEQNEPDSSANHLNNSLKNLSLSETTDYQKFDECAHFSALGSRRRATRALLPEALAELVPRAVFRVARSTRVQLELSPSNETRGRVEADRSRAAPVVVVGLERERERLESLLEATTGLSSAEHPHSLNELCLRLSSASASARLSLVPRGALVVGPAGCGKTLLVQWLLSRCDAAAYSHISASISR